MKENNYHTDLKTRNKRSNIKQLLQNQKLANDIAFQHYDNIKPAMTYWALPVQSLKNIITKHFEKKYFSNVFNDLQNRRYPFYRIGDEHMKSYHEDHNYAYEAKLSFLKDNLVGKIKKYMKSGKNC